MIRCSAFFLAQDVRMAEKAFHAAGRIDRSAMDVRMTECAGLRLVTLRLKDGDDLPAVHGWLGEESGGEYSIVEEEGGAVVARRDAFGTRPLYAARSGGWFASDHRFIRDEPLEALRPGARVEVGAKKKSLETRGTAAFDGTFEAAAGRLAGLIETSVKERVSGHKLVAVAFSGGLDSSILAVCALKHARIMACSAFAPGSADSKAASDAANAIGLELVDSALDRPTVARELNAIDLPFEPSPMDRGLWCIYSLVARSAAEAGAEFIMLGQLADELFGGYAKYERALRDDGAGLAAAMMNSDVSECGMRGFTRDEAACSRSLEPRFPFADRRVAEFGMSLPVGFKIRGGVRKAVLREAATMLGVPEEIIDRPKKAAQYSTGVMKLLP
ncbi:MAG: asparagine synthase-related protein [Nitrososphaerales archaeon]|nr:asparagine synthase-related protein [Nitrososphaerales archaeon]